MTDPYEPEQSASRQLPASSSIVAPGVAATFSTEHRGGQNRTVAKLTGVTHENLPMALERAEAMLAPAPKEHLEQWIAAMHAGTKHRSEDTAGLDLVLNLYRGLLRRYPASVAREACVRLTTGSEWFPTAKEVCDLCDRLSAQPRAVLAALQGWKPLSPVERDARRLWAKAQEKREEQASVNRRLGFVGNIAELTPERRNLFDLERQLAREVNELEQQANRMGAA
jgi:hypothetical protein